MLAFVQTLDPAGVGARTLRECLLPAARAARRRTRRAAISRSSSRATTCRPSRTADLATLRRALGADEDALQVALALVRGCHPRPGSAFEGAQPEYVVPDVFVRRTEQGWAVEINPASVPRLKVNQGYASLVVAFGRLRLAAHAAAGGALADPQPRDPQRDAAEGGPLDRRSARRRSSSAATKRCSR